MTAPIRAPEALQDEAFQRAHVRKQVTDWTLILEEARNLVAFAFVAFVGVYALLSL